MKKEKYERTELEVVEFETEDVIMTSGIEYEDDELPLTPNIYWGKFTNKHFFKSERSAEFVKNRLLVQEGIACQYRIYLFYGA